MTVENGFRQELEEASSICFLTGAGVSTNSGIPDFQTLDAEWDFPVTRTEATSLSFFHRQPQQFWDAYKYIFDLKQAAPNAFHAAVAQLENRGKKVTVVTQNIDGLHRQAGSSTVWEVHGNSQWLRCSRPSCTMKEPVQEFLTEKQLPRCSRCRKFLRPDVVLFEETPLFYREASEAVLKADMLIVAGASLQVYPVSDLPLLRMWEGHPGASVWMNKDCPPDGYGFTHALQGDLSQLAELLYLPSA